MSEAQQHASGSYKIASDRAAAEREQRRLDALARVLDPGTQRVLRERGLAPGWRCLEVGGGSGSVARWLASQVVPGGSVLSTDVDRITPDELRDVRVAHTVVGGQVVFSAPDQP